MASNHSIINLSYESSDSSESLTSPSPLRMPTLPRGLTKEQAKKKRHDVPPPSSSSSEDLPPYPSDLDDSDTARELERQWNSLDRANRAPNSDVSPFIFTSSDEDDDETDALYNPSSTPEKPQSSRPKRPSRARKSNPPLPKTREVVIGLPCPQQQGLFTNNKGKEKMADVKGKGKGKVE